VEKRKYKDIKMKNLIILLICYLALLCASCGFAFGMASALLSKIPRGMLNNK